MKRIATLFLTLVMLLSMLSGTAAVAEDAPNYRIIPEGETFVLNISLCASGKNDDYVNNEFTKWIQEQTGITLNITTLPVGQSKDKMNMMLVSGTYPDIILGYGFSLPEQQLYAEQGIFLPLKDLMTNYAPNFMKQLDTHFADNDILFGIQLPDGDVYSWPNLVDCYHCTVSKRMWIYKPWLDALNLEVPTTTDEMYAVLKAFKEQDPNGNGIADEIPMSSEFEKFWKFFMNAFVQCGHNGIVYIEDDTVKLAYHQEAWRDGMRYLNKMYKEGLIAPETFTQSKDQLMQMVENDTMVVGSSHSSNPPGNRTIENGRWTEYVCVPALLGPEGFRSVAMTPSAGREMCAFFTDKLDTEEKRIIATKFMDTLYIDEVNRRGNFGVKGVDWFEPAEGQMGYTGVHPAVIDLGVQEGGTEMNHSWYQSLPQVQPHAFRLGRVMTNESEKRMYEAANACMYPYSPGVDSVMPLVVFESTDIAAEVVDLETTIQAYAEESFARFVTGDLDLDKDWDAYLKNLDAMGYYRYLELQQAAYNAKKGL